MSVSGIPHPLVIFDGECALCNHWVIWLLKRDREHRLFYASNSSEVAQRLLTHFELVDLRESSVFFFNGAELLSHSDAALMACALLPAPYSWLAVLRVVPRCIRNFVYGITARFRYRVFGKTSECALIDEELRRLFVR